MTDKDTRGALTDTRHVIALLLNAMNWWGAQEDGIPEECAGAVETARTLLSAPSLPAGDGLTDEGAVRIACQIMANLEDRNGVLDGVDDETKTDIADEIAVAIRTALAAHRQPDAASGPDADTQCNPNDICAGCRCQYSQAASQQLGEMGAGVPYKDSTPELKIGDSSFESWYQQYAARLTGNPKQTARDAYAAGMGDPLVVARHGDGMEKMLGEWIAKWFPDRRYQSEYFARSFFSQVRHDADNAKATAHFPASAQQDEPKYVQTTDGRWIPYEQVAGAGGSQEVLHFARLIERVAHPSPAAESDKSDSERLNWLQTFNDGFHNIDRISSTRKTGFNGLPTLRDAIDAAMSREQSGGDHG